MKRIGGGGGGDPQARRIPEKNGIGPPSCCTNQSKDLAKTRSPGRPFSARMAFRRDLVVVVCQPPSHSWIQPSPILAIKLPCRRTSATSGTWKVTVVLPLLQFLPWAIAAFIWDSILRMSGGVPLTLIEYTETPSCGGEVDSSRNRPP